MAKGKKTGGRNFQKGKPGGPGRPKIAPEVTALKNLNTMEVQEAIRKVLTANTQQLAAIIADDQAPRIMVALARMVEIAIIDGCTTRMNMLLDRTIGKVKDQVEVSQKPFIIERRDGTEVVMGHKAESDE